MCYHKAQRLTSAEVAEYYRVKFNNAMFESYIPQHHENGFDFKEGPIVAAGRPDELSSMHWGLVPWWVKSSQEAFRLRVSTLNCISEEMYDKPSFRDAAKENKRCLIPCSGFYEWRWMDAKGKVKIPYYVFLKDQPTFSIAGLYASWKDKSNDTYYNSYTVCTTKANSLMEKIHNSKKRMPVIIPREYERDWLNSNLNEDDVLALCQPLDGNLMDAYTISKRITQKGIDTNFPEIASPQAYAEVTD